MQIAGIASITIETSFTIVLILLLRKCFGERLHPVVMKFLWVIPALRILLPIEIPVDLLGWDVLSRFFEAAGKLQWQPQGISYFQGILLWVSGSLVVFLFFVVKNWKFGHMLKQNREVHGKKDGILVYFVNRKMGSCLEGLLFPRIYVSRLAEDSFDWCTWIVRHELCHYYAGDNWYGLMRSLCLLLQWYNPLVWYAAKCSVEDCEIACDYKVLKDKTPEEQIIYGKCLVAMAAKKPESFWKRPVAGSSLEDGSLKKRIKRIGEPIPSMRVLEPLLVCSMLVVLAFSFLGSYEKERTIINVLDQFPIVGERIFCYQLEEPTAENMEQILRNMQMRNREMGMDAIRIMKADRESAAVVFPLFGYVISIEEQADSIAYNPKLTLKTLSAEHTFEVTEDMLQVEYHDGYDLYVYSDEVGVELKPHEQYGVYLPQRFLFAGEAEENGEVLLLTTCNNYDSMYDKSKLMTTRNPCNLMPK